MSIDTTIAEALEACRLLTDELPDVEIVQSYLALYPGIEVSAEQIEAVQKRIDEIGE